MSGSALAAWGHSGFCGRMGIAAWRLVLVTWFRSCLIPLCAGLPYLTSAPGTTVRDHGLIDGPRSLMVFGERTTEQGVRQPAQAGRELGRGQGS